MRFLLKIHIPVESGNKALKDGSMLKQVQSYLKEVKPEVVYFSPANGQRTMYMVVNVPSSDHIPLIAEPLWLDFRAVVHFIPVMNAEEFEKAGPSIQKIAESRK